MAHIEPQSPAFSEPLRTTNGRRDLLIFPNETWDGCQRYINSCEINTDASVISTANFGLTNSPNNHGSVMDWESLPGPIARSNYSRMQEAEANKGWLLPSYGIPISNVSDSHSLVVCQELASQPDFFLSQAVERPDGAETAQGSHYLPMNSLCQTRPQYDCNSDCMNMMQVQQNVPMESAPHILLDHCDGLEPRLPVLQDAFACHPPWSMVFPHETEEPLGATFPVVPMLQPTPWPIGTLVDDIPSQTEVSITTPPCVLMASEHSKSPTSSEFTFVSAPMPWSPGEANIEGQNLSSISSQNGWRSRQIAWKAETGERVNIKQKRTSTKAERRDSRLIHDLGGPCPKCKKGKRKCDPSHILCISEASTTSSPPSTSTSLGSSWIMASPRKKQTVKLTDPPAPSYCNHLLPSALPLRQRAGRAPGPLYADAELRPGQVFAYGEGERSMLRARSATSGNERTNTFYLNAREDDLSNTIKSSNEASSSAPSLNDWDHTPFAQAYLGLGGQFGSIGPL